MSQAFSLTLFSFVPKVVWDGLWLFVPVATQERQDLISFTWGLSIVTMDIGEPPLPTDVLVTSDPLIWLQLTAFLLTPEGACLDGCERFVPL